MPLYGEKKAELSMRLTVRIENLVKEFCVEKKIPHGDIPELLDCRAINRLAQNLGLNVKVAELEEPIINPKESKETPLEIINRASLKVEKNEITKRSLSPRGGLRFS